MSIVGDIYESLIKKYNITESNNKKTITTKVLNENINNIDNDEILCYDFYEYPGGNPYICIMYYDTADKVWDLYADVSINTDYEVGPDAIVVNNDLSDSQAKEVYEDLAKEELDSIDKGHSTFKVWQLRDDWKQFILDMQKDVKYDREDLTEGLKNKFLNEGGPSIDDLPFEEIMNKKPTKGNMDWYKEDHPEWKRVKDKKDKDKKSLKESISLEDAIKYELSKDSRFEQTQLDILEDILYSDMYEDLDEEDRAWLEKILECHELTSGAKSAIINLFKSVGADDISFDGESLDESIDVYDKIANLLDKPLKEDWDDEYEDEKYSLVGQDGNAFALMGYTARCMKECGLKDEISKMREEATSSDYNNLICVCDSYVQRCNEIARDLNEGKILNEGDNFNKLMSEISNGTFNSEEFITELVNWLPQNTLEEFSIYILNDVLNENNEAIIESIDKKREVKKMSESNKRIWDPDEHLQKVVKYYKDWAGFGDDEIITEDMLKNEEWRLKRVSSMKNTPVKKIRAELLKQKDSE